MTSPCYCLDTHSLIWYFTGSSTLSPKAFETLEQIFSGEAVGIISVIVILEALHVSYKHKGFVFPKFLEALKIPTITICPLEKEVLMEGLMLPKKLNIHDRVVVATAIVNDCPLITKDRIIKSIREVESIW